MAELTVEVNLKKVLQPWGLYKKKGDMVSLYDNASIKDPQFLEICKKNKVRIQLDLFTPIPDDKE